MSEKKWNSAKQLRVVIIFYFKIKKDMWVLKTILLSLFVLFFFFLNKNKKQRDPKSRR